MFLWCAGKSSRMEEMLQTWGISENSILHFVDNNIDLSCLDGIGEEELKVLIPDNLRDRIKFKIGFKKYKQDMAVVDVNTDSCDTLSVSGASVDSLESIIFNEENKTGQCKLNLQDILQDSMPGRQAFQAIKDNKVDPKARTKLVQTVVDYYIKKFQKMTKVDFETITGEIVQLCPNECKETYYVPSRTIGSKVTIPAKGKLVDRYYNQLRTLRGSGVLPKKRKVSCGDTSENETSTDNDADEPMKEKHTWLKFNRDPWPVVEEKWRETCAYRKNNYYKSDKPLTEVINDWPCLKHSFGYQLIEIDFTYLYPDTCLQLFTKWNSFQNRASGLIAAEIGEHELKQHLKEGTDNTKDFAVLSLLAHKIKPTSKLPKTDKKGFNKVSIVESKQAFVMLVKNYADINEALLNRRRSYNRKGLTCQPMIICIGTPAALDGFFVVIDDMKYRFDSLRKAVDVCFKCFMVLNLTYPKECEQLWLFIQHYFYDILLTSDKKFSQVSNFIKELQE